MRITVHYVVEKWPEGHYHYCFPSHVVKCGKNDVFYIHLCYNFVHVYAHFIFYIERHLLKVDDSNGFIPVQPVKVATLLHSCDATNFSPMVHETMLNRIPESCLCWRLQKLTAYSEWITVLISFHWYQDFRSSNKMYNWVVDFILTKYQITRHQIKCFSRQNVTKQDISSFST